MDRLQSWAYIQDNQFIGSTFIPVSKTLDHISGNYAVALRCDPAYSGGITSINIGNSTQFGPPTFPLSVRHNCLNAYIKYDTQSGDTLHMMVNMYSNGILVGEGDTVFTSAIHNYEPVSVPILYRNFYHYDIPDSAAILIELGSVPPHGNSVAFVDNLSFDGFHITDVDPITSDFPQLKSDDIKVYPNPTNTNITVEWNSMDEENGMIQLTDINGRLVKEVSFSHEPNMRKKISVAELENGLYFLRLQLGNRVMNKKIMVVR